MTTSGMPWKGKMQKFTVFVQEANGEGTVHIECYTARDMEAACTLALENVRQAWGADCYNVEDLHVLGVAEGDVKILHWEDLNE